VIRAVIVDVDDTLCLTEAASFELENEVLARMGRPPMSRAVHLSTWGEVLLDAMPHRSPGLDLRRFAELFPAVHREFLAAGRLDVVPPENLEALDELVSNGRTVLLLTSRAEPDECVYVGDSPGDAIAAGGAGIRFIACLQSGVRRLDEFDPRYVTASVDAFPDLVAVVERLQETDRPVPDRRT
jgi:phosphoglycolate phosphatase